MTAAAITANGRRHSRLGPLLGLGAAFGILTTSFKITDGTHAWWDVTLTTLSGYLFLVAGAVAATRQRSQRVGLLMVLCGIATFAEDVQLAAHPAVHTSGLLLTAASSGVLAHLMLAFPDGRLERRVDQVLVALAYGWSLVLTPLTVPFVRTAVPNLLLVTEIGWVRDTVGQLSLPIAVAVLAALGQRWWVTRPSMRYVLTPVVVTSILIGVSTVGAAAAWNLPGGLYRAFIVGYQVIACLLPLAFLVGVLRIRLGRSTVARLVEALDRPVSAEGLRGLLGGALGDPTLTIAYRRTDGSGLVTEEGTPVSMPDPANPRRAVTDVTHDGRPVAVLLHDPALLEDEHVLRAVATAAGLALENERLNAELRAQLAEVRRSRFRINAAGQAERIRIERDLHDGVQAKLVAALISVRQATAEGVGSKAGPAIRPPLERAAAGLDEALADLRRIAHGIRPAVLAEAGLGPAIRSVLDGTGLPYALDLGELPALPPEVEETMYYVVAEASTNVCKHAGASRIVVGLVGEPEAVSVTVTDDGRGGAQVREGGGLQGLQDRVAAVDGRLRVESSAARGTAVTAIFGLPA